MILPDLAGLAVDVSRLSLLPGNPRIGDVDAVAASLAAFGQRKPIVAKRDGTVVAGNHTLQAARQLGWSEIAVVWVDDDDPTAAAFALADNRTAELGSYDEAALAKLIAEVQAADEDLLAASGWTGDDLAEIIARLEAEKIGPSDGDPDAAPERAPALTVPGDVWLLGPHRLLCGDATVSTDYDRVLAGDRADMVWTDPPYGVSYVGKTAEALTIDNDALTPAELESFLRAAFVNVLGALQPGGCWYTAAPPGPLFLAFGSVLHEMDVWRQTLSWVKNSFVMGRSDYHYRHEAIFYGWAPGAAHHAPSERTHDTVLEFDRPQRSADHPTMKPVSLISYCVENSSDPGQIVLDPFGGSGSTLIAAHQSRRRARLIELDPRYCDVICRRYQELTGDKPISEATGNPHDFTEDSVAPKNRKAAKAG